MNYLPLAKVILDFGHVLRITRDSQGRRESDTTHSLMLALVAYDLAVRENEVRTMTTVLHPLDLEKVLIFALVHDLPEVRAGDTPTLRELDAAGQLGKDQREEEARKWLRAELPDLPWLLDAMEEYELQQCREARLVKAADKLLPKLTHLCNDGLVLKEQGVSLEEVAARIERQRHQQRVHDLPVVAAALRDAGATMIAHLRGCGFGGTP